MEEGTNNTTQQHNLEEGTNNTTQQHNMEEGTNNTTQHGGGDKQHNTTQHGGGDKQHNTTTQPGGGDKQHNTTTQHGRDKQHNTTWRRGQTTQHNNTTWRRGQTKWLSLSCTHKFGGKGWLYSLLLQSNPIDGSEKGMSFYLPFTEARLATKPSRRILYQELHTYKIRKTGTIKVETR